MGAISMDLKDLTREDWGRLDDMITEIKPKITPGTLLDFQMVRDSYLYKVNYDPASTTKRRMESAFWKDFTDIPIWLGRNTSPIYDVVYKFRLEKGV